MNLIRFVRNSFQSWEVISLGACELALHERCSALEQEHSQLAWVVQVETLIGLAGDFKAKAFAHHAVERLSILSIHLFFHDFASLLKEGKETRSGFAHLKSVTISRRFRANHHLTTLTLMSTPVAPDAFSIPLVMCSLASFSTSGSMSVSYDQEHEKELLVYEAMDWVVG